MRAEELYLSTEGYIASCDFGLDRSVAGTDTSEITRSSQNLEYTWTVTRVSDLVDVTSYAVLSTGEGEAQLKSPRVLYMPGYSLDPGEEYLFTATVYSPEHTSSNTARSS